MNNGAFDFNLFIQESKETLLNPKSYFSTLKTEGGLTEPLIKAAIYGAVAGIFYFLWAILGFGMGAGALFGGSSGILMLIYSVIGSVIGMFIGAVILLLISSICNGRTDYEANARVTASLMVVMPITAALAFTFSISLYLGMTIGLIVKLYSLWLLYYALIETLKGKVDTAKNVSYVFVALVVIFFLFSVINIGRYQGL